MKLRRSPEGQLDGVERFLYVVTTNLGFGGSVTPYYREEASMHLREQLASMHSLICEYCRKAIAGENSNAYTFCKKGHM
jgi:hypothetical protein